MKKLLILFLLQVANMVQAQSSITIADPAIGALQLNDATTNVKASANGLSAGGSMSIIIPIYNLNQFNAIPTGGITITINLAKSFSMAKSQNLAFSALAEYFSWSSIGSEIIGTQIAPIPADSYGTRAQFNIDAAALGYSGTITASLVVNRDILQDEATANNAASLSFNTTATPLPLRLISFEGKTTTKGNLLSWKTTSEQNFSHYEVERSADAKTFEIIGKVEGAGNSNEQLSYDFVDKFSSSGMVPGANVSINDNDFYYRLKMVDLDGQFAFSKVIYLKKAEETEIKVYPNPAADFINIENLNGKHLNIKVLDGLGREIIGQFESNNNQVVIPIKGVSTGAYFIQIQDEKQTIYRKVIINK